MDSEKFEPIEEQKTKGNKSKVMIIGIVAILIILVLAVVVIAGNSNSEAVFKKQIDKMLTYKTVENYDTIKANWDLEMKIEGEATKGMGEFVELINDTKISINAEIDNETQEQVLGIKLDKSDDELIDAKAKLDSENQKIYLDLGQFFNKTIELDISDVLEDGMDTETTEPLNFMQFVTAQKAMAILRKEVKAEFKSEYFSTEKVTIENEKLTKNILKLTGRQFKEILENICTNLANNEEFIDCFEDENEVKDTLNEVKYELNDMDFSYDMQMEIDLYTKGIFTDVNRVDIVMTEDNETIAMEVTQKAEEEYTYKLLENNEGIMEGTIKIHTIDNKTEVEATAEAEDTKVTAKAAINTVYNEELTDINTQNAVKLEELSTTDVMALYGNFMGSKLYEIFEKIYGAANELPSNNATQNNLELESKNNNNSVSSKGTTPDNVVQTFDGEKIEFSIPNGYEKYSSDSDSYKLFEKETNDDSIDVDVSTTYSTLTEYIDEAKDMLEYYQEDEDYKNIQLSNVEEINVNGNKFSKIVLSYDYEFWEGRSEKREKAFFAYEIDSKYLYTVEVDNPNLMTEAELQQFLSIQRLD